MLKLKLMILFALSPLLWSCSTAVVSDPPAPVPANMLVPCKEKLPKIKDGTRSSVLMIGVADQEAYGVCRDRHNALVKYIKQEQEK